MSAPAPSPILNHRKSNATTIPTMNFVFGIFFALDNLYPFNPKNANDTKNIHPKKTHVMIIKSDLALTGFNHI
ncbi:MAG: hypothetical protein WCJ81_01420 [bacterium]